MRRANGFTLIELIIVMTIIGVLMSVMVPNFRLLQVRSRDMAVKMNMTGVSEAIMAYLAENGHYADDFYEDGYGYIFDGGVEDSLIGQLPINPFTGEVMSPDDFNPDEYDTPQDVSDPSGGGENDEWGYDPGTMRYATWTPLGQYYPTMWGLIGFDNNGLSLRSFDDQGNVVVYVVHQ